jgi:hypothetical protein
LKICDGKRFKSSHDYAQLCKYRKVGKKLFHDAVAPEFEESLFANAFQDLRLGATGSFDEEGKEVLGLKQFVYVNIEETIFSILKPSLYSQDDNDSPFPIASTAIPWADFDLSAKGLLPYYYSKSILDRQECRMIDKKSTHS